MLTSFSIKSLYALALAEGEGVGTAYEYFAKRLVLQKWLQKRPSTILIAGLPQKYGSSLDFVQLAAETGAALTIVDDRPEALAKAQRSLVAAQQAGWLTAVSPIFIPVAHLGQMSELTQDFDLALSSEALQRLDGPQRQGYVARLLGVATVVALFCPNGDNPAHTNLSGLSGLTLAQLQALFSSVLPLHRCGYIDMPPFPPGIIRSEEQREQATSGKFEAFAMWGLGYFARAEKFLPTAVRRRQSHIVYALADRG